MGLPKGWTNNYNGRPKGSKNKKTETIRTFIDNLVRDNYEKILDDLNELDPYQRLTIIEKFIGYVLPKRSAVDASINLERLSDDELNDLFERLIKANGKQ